MSESNAERSKFVAEVTKLKINEEDETLEIESQNGSDVKGQVAEKVEGGSEIGGKVAQIDSDNDKVEDEGEGYIQFLFKPEVEETVLNEYVIKEIAKYLGFRDLRSLRRVNTLWSTGATPAFVAKAVFALNSLQKSQEQLKAFGAETERLKKVTALRMDLCLLYYSGFEEIQLFRNIFWSLAPSLTALELINCTFAGFFIADGGIQISLPALTSLTLKETRHAEGREGELFAYLYTAAPALRQLHVDNLRPQVLSPLLAEDGSRNWAIAPNLSSFGMSCSFKFFYLDNFLPLVTFPQSWERLDIGIFGLNQHPGPAPLAQLLEANKDCLLGLKLELESLPTFWRPNQPPMFILQNERIMPTLQFPTTFSKLEELELGFGRFWGVINFGDGNLNYTETFPSLTSFSVKLSKDVETTTGIWNTLFPPQVFGGLRELKVEGMSYLRDEEIRQDWAEQMFPNARLQIV